MTSIRPESPSDRDAVRAVHLASFPTNAEARLVELLRDGGHLTVSLVAEVDGEVVGHIAFSAVTTALGAVGLGLAPLAVMPTHRRRGIAARLVRQGIATAAALGFGWAVVLGAPSYYGRYGFRPASEVGLMDEYGGGDAFQVLEIVPGSLPYGAGLVRYAQEFAAAGRS